MTSESATPFKPLIRGRFDPLAIGAGERARSMVGRRYEQCPVHGQFAATVYADGRLGGCPRCLIEQSAVKQAQQQEQERQQNLVRHCLRLLGHDLVPQRFLHASFANYREYGGAKQQRVLAKLQDYALNFPRYCERGAGLMLSGNTGTGKTHLAFALGREISHRHQQSFVYTTLGHVLRAVRSSFNAPDIREAEIYQVLAAIIEHSKGDA